MTGAQYWDILKNDVAYWELREGVYSNAAPGSDGIPPVMHEMAAQKMISDALGTTPLCRSLRKCSCSRRFTAIERFHLVEDLQ